MPSRSDGANAVLYTQVQRRMVESGEWDRLSVIIMQKLNESGWVDDIHHRSKETARAAGPNAPTTARQLMHYVREHAEASVSPAIRQEIMGLIRQYLDSQIDK